MDGFQELGNRSFVAHSPITDIPRPPSLQGLLKIQPLTFRVRIYFPWWISRSPADDLMRPCEMRRVSPRLGTDAKNTSPHIPYDFPVEEGGVWRGSGPTYIVLVSWMGRFSPGKRSGDRPEREWGNLNPTGNHKPSTAAADCGSRIRSRPQLTPLSHRRL